MCDDTEGKTAPCRFTAKTGGLEERGGIENSRAVPAATCFVNRRSGKYVFFDAAPICLLRRQG
jgi:hypothetical protein